MGPHSDHLVGRQDVLDHGLEDRLRVNIADMRDEHGLRYLVQGQDIIFNLAGQVSHTDSMVDPYTDLEINARSQLSLLEACRHGNPAAKVVFASTRQIYGRPEYLPVDERHPLQPVDINGINKLAGEWYHMVYHQVYGLRTVSLRLTNTYGPRMRIRDARQTFIGWWFRQLLEGQTLSIFGVGLQVRDFNYIDDVIEALLMVAFHEAADGQIYNLGSDDPINLLNLARLMIEVNGGGQFDLRPFPDERKRIDIGDYYGDYRRIRGHIERVVPGFDNFEQRIATPGGFALPNGPRDAREFATADGKAHFVPAGCDGLAHQCRVCQQAVGADEAIGQCDAGGEPVRVRGAGGVLRREAEEAQDAQLVFLDAGGGRSDKHDSFPQDVRVTPDMVMDFSGRIAVQRIDGEVPAQRIRLPVIGEGHDSAPPIGLHVMAQRGDFVRRVINHRSHRAMLNAGGMNRNAGRLESRHHILRRQRGCNVDVANGLAQQRIAHRASGHARLSASRGHQRKNLLQAWLFQPAGTGE